MADALTLLTTALNAFGITVSAKNINNLDAGENVNHNPIITSGPTKINVWIGDLWIYQGSSTEIETGDIYLSSVSDQRV